MLDPTAVALLSSFEKFYCVLVRRYDQTLRNGSVIATKVTKFDVAVNPRLANSSEYRPLRATIVLTGPHSREFCRRELLARF
jgi:hypothetical protein